MHQVIEAKKSICHSSKKVNKGNVDELLFAENRLTMEEAITKNITRGFDDCSDRNCEYGLLNSQQMVQYMSAWGPLIYAGCLSGSLSAAIGALEGAPRVFQASIYPL